MHAQERDAVIEVVEDGTLSGFFGSAGDHFLGGPKVRDFEANWAELFGYRHAVSLNSWSTGLIAAAGAARLGPGDEIICPPLTMSASATSAMFYGAVPVFADVDPRSFCLDPAAVEAAITPRTKAIMVVHLFGGPADMTAIGAIAAQHDLIVIEDAAQAPLASFHGRNVGALFHIGGFSLNYHKHIHTGEGGMVVTDDAELAQRCQLIRNHGENLAGALELDDLTNVIGSNFRLTELQAAIGIVQLGRLAGIVAHRRELASHVARRLEGCPAVDVPAPAPGIAHSYYVYPMLYNEAALEIPRERFVAAVAAELPPPRTADDIALHAGYVEPLYLNPLFQRRVAIGSRGYPFTAAEHDADLYAPGRCPVAEHLHCSTLMYTTLVRDPLGVDDVDDLVAAIEKVVEHADELRG